MAQMRLDKLLTHLNCGSRKEVQALIRAGRVSVEGQVGRDPAAKLDPEAAAVSACWPEQPADISSVICWQQFLSLF